LSAVIVATVSGMGIEIEIEIETGIAEEIVVALVSIVKIVAAARFSLMQNF
jgi:hypothetical protein